MPCGRGCQKAILDCTGYRKEMDNMVDMIVCDAENDKDIIEKFGQLQSDQEKMWKDFTLEHYGF